MLCVNGWNLVYNHGHNTLKLDVRPNFPFTTNETKRNC